MDLVYTEKSRFSDKALICRVMPIQLANAG